MGIPLIKISVAYFAIGVAIGYYMSSAHSYTLTPIHVHISLLGWTALTLDGILYHLFPNLARTLSGTLVATGTTITSLGIFSFVINIFKNLKPP